MARVYHRATYHQGARPKKSARGAAATTAPFETRQDAVRPTETSPSKTSHLSTARNKVNPQKKKKRSLFPAGMTKMEKDNELHEMAFAQLVRNGIIDQHSGLPSVQGRSARLIYDRPIVEAMNKAESRFKFQADDDDDNHPDDDIDPLVWQVDLDPDESMKSVKIVRLSKLLPQLKKALTQVDADLIVRDSWDGRSNVVTPNSPTEEELVQAAAQAATALVNKIGRKRIALNLPVEEHMEETQHPRKKVRQDASAEDQHEAEHQGERYEMQDAEPRMTAQKRKSNWDDEEETLRGVSPSKRLKAAHIDSSLGSDVQGDEPEKEFSFAGNEGIIEEPFEPPGARDYIDQASKQADAELVEAHAEGMLHENDLLISEESKALSETQKASDTKHQTKMSRKVSIKWQGRELTSMTMPRSSPPIASPGALVATRSSSDPPTSALLSAASLSSGTTLASLSSAFTTVPAASTAADSDDSVDDAQRNPTKANNAQPQRRSSRTRQRSSRLTQSMSSMWNKKGSR